MCGGGLLGGWRASPMAAAHAIAQASPACEPARCSRLGREREPGASVRRIAGWLGAYIMHMCMCISMCMCSMRMRMCMCACVHVCMCMCMCMQVHVHVRLQACEV